MSNTIYLNVLQNMVKEQNCKKKYVVKFDWVVVTLRFITSMSIKYSRPGFSVTQALKFTNVLLTGHINLSRKHNTDGRGRSRVAQFVEGLTN